MRHQASTSPEIAETAEVTRTATTADGLVEVRWFTVRPGCREEFDRISREGTLPMMRRHGFSVLGHGPSVLDEDTWVLIRWFADEADRIGRSERFYATREWAENYEEPVMGMIADYRSALLPATPALRALALDQLAPASAGRS